MRTFSFNLKAMQCVAMLFFVGGSASASAATTEVVLLQSNISARSYSLLNNLNIVAASPFSGIVLNMPATYTAMLNSERLNYNAVVDNWLTPLVGVMPKLSGSYLNVNLRDSGDPFGNWDVALANWGVIARAAKEAGMRGIYFDNEAYVELGAFTFPGNADNPSLGVGAYQEQFRQRGTDVMNALQAEWSGVEIVSLHGPYVSEPSTPASVRLDQVGASGDDMRGFFFAGMLAAKNPLAKVTDGGEVYQYRTQTDFENSVAWRRFGMTQIAGGRVVPAGQRDTWADDISLTFGLFDQQWRPNGEYPMTPDLLEEALFQALMLADSPVWLYAESNDYLVPGGVSSDWTDAIANARARAVLAQGVTAPAPIALSLLGLIVIALRMRRRGALI